MTRHKHVKLLLVLLVLVVACGEGDGLSETTPSDSTAEERTETTHGGQPTETTADQTTSPKLERVPEGGPPVVGEVPQEILNPILEDAATRSEVDSSALEVIRSEQVLWNDGSLGCPEPGEFYTQAKVDGYWVVLEHADQQLDYRVTAEGTFRLCESAQPRPPSG